MSDFVEANKPRHQGLELLGELDKLVRKEGIYSAFSSTFRPEEVQDQKKLDLFDAYGARLQEIVEDALRRPEHYSIENLKTLEDMKLGKSPTAAAKTDLFLTWYRPSSVAKVTTQAVLSTTQRRHQDLGSSSFENQDLGEIIVL